MRTLFGLTNKKKNRKSESPRRVEGLKGQPRARKEGRKSEVLTKEQLVQNRIARRQKRTKTIAKLTPQMKLKREAAHKKAGSFLSGLNWNMTYDIGIDLGTANVLLYVKGRGLVLDEPGFVARDTKTQEVLAVGAKARRMWGRTPVGMEVIRPLQEGVIADYDMTEFMLRHFVRAVVPASVLVRTRIVACVPSGITPVGKRAILEALLRTGARKTVLIEEPLAAAMGTGLDKARDVGAMVVDMGGGTTDIAVVCDSGVVVSESLPIGGDRFDEAIVRYIKRKRRLVIGYPTAEEIKISIGTVDRKAPKQDMVVRGRDLGTGLPKSTLVSSQEIQEAMEAHMVSILEGIKNILEKTPPELVAAIADHGIILTGGGALLDGVDRIITRVIGIAAYLVEAPRYAVIRGTAKALEEMSSLQDTLEELQ